MSNDQKRALGDDFKNAFSEKTVVQSRQSFLESESENEHTSEMNIATDDISDEQPAQASAHTPEASTGGEKTVVFAHSNLKETFDARTVVRISKPTPAREPIALPQEAPVSVSPAVSTALPPSMPPPPPTFAPEESSPRVVAASLAEPREVTNSDIKFQTGVHHVSDDAAPKKKLSQTERRDARKALDRKTRTMVAALATLCALVILCLVVAFGGPKDGVKTADDVKPRAQGVSGASTEMASTGAPGPNAGAPQGLPDYQSTTDVLSKFDKAAQKAATHAF